ncbi:hypothetical protein [Mesorhizobium sp.]|uniref:hypothetical protein n=1 Tax=Mesorhizobium sp. TaxID=1871066 RepID=UPI000FE847DA|nr:hypothetical protein [Mesorhizobium sp.]RWC58935.1 MAG: hypothetical protein EOS56_18675 [Mesorhizobium sp.]RWC66547.1 MAG: hypothetical protein EOS29_04030 [Mesorhizobium sp.]
MALTAYYSAGFATLTNGTAAVVGVGTAWTTNYLAPGDQIETDSGQRATILTINSPTSITLDKLFRGTTQAAQPYKIWRTFDAQYLMEGARKAYDLLGSSGIAALAALDGAADQGMYFTGPGVLAAFALTAAGRALLDDANVPAQRATLGLGSAALKNTGTSGNNVPLLDGANTWSAVQRNTGKPICRAGRTNSTETLLNNTEYAILGSFNVNQGGFAGGAAVASGGNRLVVPVTGYYRISQAIYVSGVTGGRLNIITNGNSAFTCTYATTMVAGEKSYSEGIVLMTAGDTLSYYITSANVQIFSASNHTEVFIEHLG